MYVIKARLSNPGGPESQTVEVSFPIQNYEDVYERLARADMSGSVARESRVASIESGYRALEGLWGRDVNVDELDYLAKILDSFSDTEALQFEGVAAAKGIADIEDLINLTFCCTQATVISDFSDLNAVGKQHYLNTHGGSAPVSVIDALDGAEEARELILEKPGTVTPFGVVYDNGMVLERYYAGREFPAYLYDVPLLTVDVSKKSAPDEPATCLCLPMPEVCLKRALARGGFDDPADMNLEMRVLAVPSDIFRWIAPNTETPEGLNAAAGAIAGLSESDRHTFCAVAEYLEPESSADLRALAERIGQFEFYEGVSTAEEYGRRLITEMGCFMRDIDMDEFFDFEGFGKRRLENEQGGFMGEGYIRYDGDIPLEKLLTQTRQHHGQGMTMGGI